MSAFSINITPGLPAYIAAASVVNLAAIFVIAGMLCVSVLFCSRVIKSYLEHKTARQKIAFQKILNKIIVNESNATRSAAEASFEYHLAELRTMTKSTFAKQVLITMIIALHKNLKGTSSNALRSCYNKLSLYDESRNKLGSFAWKKRALGIRELAEMSHAASVPLIARFLYTKNKILRQEAFTALVRLEPSPLTFLHSYKGDLTLWMRMNISRCLSKLERRMLPVFSTLFDHPNEAVRLFSISMARQFKQTESLPGLGALLYDRDPKVVRLALNAIAEMEASHYRAVISRLAVHARRFPKLASTAVACLGKIGEAVPDIPLLATFLTHPDYNVRYETVKALKNFGDGGEQHLRNQRNSSIVGLIDHFSEPLLAES